MCANFSSSYPSRCYMCSSSYTSLRRVEGLIHASMKRMEFISSCLHGCKKNQTNAVKLIITKFFSCSKTFCYKETKSGKAQRHEYDRVNINRESAIFLAVLDDLPSLVHCLQVFNQEIVLCIRCWWLAALSSVT